MLEDVFRFTEGFVESCLFYSYEILSFDIFGCVIFSKALFCNQTPDSTAIAEIPEELQAGTQLIMCHNIIMVNSKNSKLYFHYHMQYASKHPSIVSSSYYHWVSAVCREPGQPSAGQVASSLHTQHHSSLHTPPHSKSSPCAGKSSRENPCTAKVWHKPWHKTKRTRR